MTRPLCAVVMAAYKRRHLLERSLVCYANQDFDNSRFELVVVDDHGNDGTRELVLDWSASRDIKATVLTVSPKPAEWADCGWVLNAGIRASSAEYILLTHPEVIPGSRSVLACVEQLREFELCRPGVVDDAQTVRSDRCPDRRLGLYAACRVYYLSARDQERIDTVPWRQDGVLALRGIEGFYDADQNAESKGNPDYTHEVTDLVATPGFRLQTWDSWVFGGCSRETWRRLGGMLESRRWGSVDILFNDRRKKLGMVEWTCPEPESIVAHQEHTAGSQDIPTPRDEQAWVRECKQFDLRPEAVAYPAVDHLGWGG